MSGVARASLGDSQLLFAGFEARDVARALGHADLVVGRTPPLLRLSDVVLIPEYDALYDRSGVRIEPSVPTYVEPDVGAGALADVKTAVIDARAPPVARLPRKIKRRREPALYLGRHQQHFGHFITDGLARFWALDKVDRRAKLVVARCLEEHLRTEPCVTIFKALDLDPSRILLSKKPMSFDDILCPVPAMQWGHRVYQGYDETHRRVGERLLHGHRNPALDRPIYLTRTRLAPGQRTRLFLGEAELEQRLEARGYLAVGPEQLSLRDQIHLFNHDWPVIGVGGSAMHTALFRIADGRKRIGVLTSPIIQPRLLLTDAVKRFDSVYVNCIEEMRSEPGAVAAPERTYRLDPDKAMTLLEEAGFFA